MTPSDWTLTVAIYAALVSTGLLVIRILEYRKQGGSAAVSTSFHPGTDGVPPIVTLSVTNTGSGDVTVQRLDLDGPGPVSIPLRPGELLCHGPMLPFRVEPRTSEVWHVDAERLKALLRANGWHYEVRGIVTLATGMRIWESIHRYTKVY